MSYENVYPQKVGIGQFIKGPPLRITCYMVPLLKDLFKPNLMKNVMMSVLQTSLSIYTAWNA